MGKIQYGKCGGWITPVGVLLSLLPLFSAQPGFLSIVCGGKSVQTGEDNMTWVTDANYIDVGQTAELNDDVAYGYGMHSLRVFPKPLEKSCYQLPVLPDVPYILRLLFVVGNYSGFKQLPSFVFSIETPGMLTMANVTISDRRIPIYEETIFVSSGRVLYICLIRTSELDDPFISGIQLRTLKPGMYGQAKPGTMLMSPYRSNVGGDQLSTIRYPDDKFDRIWDQFLTTTNSIDLRFVSTSEPISTNDTKELPPPAVMQTAAVICTTVRALEAIKSRFGIKDWISDPCFLIPWKGILCKNNTLPIRISEIDLSGKSLTGLVPNEIGQLTALVKLALGNNHFMGPLPNFSSLTMLETLYLQNNSLSGTFPLWLSKLKNLKELNIGNNNFSGVIPAQLLNSLVKFSYCGNAYLQIPKGECILHISTKENKLKVILGTTLTGIPIIALALIVAIIMYRNKFGRKEQGTVLEEERRSFSSGDYPVGMVPNPTKLGAFTQEEMIAATQGFSREIGRGGFGSVFLGELPRERNIAVKVLSQFSQQGIQEFLNEVDLLSRIHHKNLDIKTANILLDSNLNGKLADFGLSKITNDGEATHVTTAVKGTFGYLDPEYYSTQMLTEKSDVYSFGVVLLEIISGRAPIDRKLPEDEVNIIHWATPYLLEEDESGGAITEIIDKRLLADSYESGGTIIEIIDKRLLADSYEMKSMTCVAKVAMRCVQAGRARRPGMSEVVAELKEGMKHEEYNLLGGGVDSSEREEIEFE